MKPFPPPLPFIDTVQDQRVRKALADSRRRQLLAQAEMVPPVDNGTDEVIRPMSRRAQVKSQPFDDFGLIPDHLEHWPRANIFKTLRRLITWVNTFGTFALVTMWVSLRHRDTEELRAVRLRQAFERVGGTLIKIGQQMSIRLDLLPVVYCEELSLMLDQVPAFPVEQAITVIERATGRRLSDLFSAFDPEPIGSASIACVYQAVLRETGQKVAIKVRRPGIRQLFEVDFRVIEMLTQVAEVFTITRPGFAEGLRQEFRSSLSAELDFRREARLQEMFRRRARKADRRYFTAPKVYLLYSNHEVLIQEFISGIWLSEVLAGIERGDEAALARMRELNLDPKKLASRLLYANNWGLFDNLAFHADPHPANIVVQANNRLVFVDFGACGYLNQPRRLAYQQVHAAYLREDAYTMTKSSIISVEPFPPIDLNAVMKDVEEVFQDQLLRLKSKHAYWFERTTANSWLGTLAVLDKYKIPAPKDVLMYARATLLYDTLAARLNPKIDFYKEYQTFGRDTQVQARKRVMKSLRRRMRNGLSGTDFEAIGKLATTGSDLLFRLRRIFTAPYDFTLTSYVIEKWVFTLIMLLRFGIRSLIFTAALTLLNMVTFWLVAQPTSLSLALSQTLNSRFYQICLFVLLVIHLRRLLFRLGERTPEG
jgi:predicted unusual protein kinase regulating ubiquinone biosynthesis (AarF/ABC1/UbiB family)